MRYRIALVTVFIALLAGGCSSNPEAKQAELEQTKYFLCKNLHAELQALIDSVAETGIDKNDPRLRAFGDKWNLGNCNIYQFPDIDTNLVTP